MAAYHRSTGRAGVTTARSFFLLLLDSILGGACSSSSFSMEGGGQRVMMAARWLLWPGTIAPALLGAGTGQREASGGSAEGIRRRPWAASPLRLAGDATRRSGGGRRRKLREEEDRQESEEGGATGDANLGWRAMRIRGRGDAAMVIGRRRERGDTKMGIGRGQLGF